MDRRIVAQLSDSIDSIAIMDQFSNINENNEKSISDITNRINLGSNNEQDNNNEQNGTGLQESDKLKIVVLIAATNK